MVLNYKMSSLVSKEEDCGVRSNENVPPFLLVNAGLDPLTGVFFRLFVRDVINLHEVENDTTTVGTGFTTTPVLTYNGHLVSRVDLIGTLVMVEIRDKKHSYGLDDGTGIILCNYWPKKETPPTLPPQCQSENLPQSLQSKLSKIHSAIDRVEQGFDIGSVVRIRGRVVLHRGRKEINILNIQHLGDPKFEIDQILKLPQYYENWYDKVFVPPKFMMEGQGTGGDGDSQSVKDVVTRTLLSYLETHKENFDTFNCLDVLNWDCVQKMLTDEKLPGMIDKDVIRDCLETIGKDSGLVVRQNCGEDRYELVKSGCRLCLAVLDIIRKSCQFEDRGCLVAQMHKSLSRFSRYVTVEHAVLINVLNILELESEIICVERDRYMAIC